MVVGDFNFRRAGAFLGPLETYLPLVVDENAPLPPAPTLECLHADDCRGALGCPDGWRHRASRACAKRCGQNPRMPRPGGPDRTLRSSWQKSRRSRHVPFLRQPHRVHRSTNIRITSCISHRALSRPALRRWRSAMSCGHGDLLRLATAAGITPWRNEVGWKRGIRRNSRGRCCRHSLSSNWRSSTMQAVLVPQCLCPVRTFQTLTPVHYKRRRTEYGHDMAPPLTPLKIVLLLWIPSMP